MPATDSQRLRYLNTIVAAMSRGSGPGTPCNRRDYDLWTSTLAAERATAARLCKDCVVLQSCGQQADARKETTGVWGGRDRT